MCNAQQTPGLHCNKRFTLVKQAECDLNGPDRIYKLSPSNHCTYSNMTADYSDPRAQAGVFIAVNSFERIRSLIMSRTKIGATIEDCKMAVSDCWPVDSRPFADMYRSTAASCAYAQHMFWTSCKLGNVKSSLPKLEWLRAPETFFRAEQGSSHKAN